MRPHSHHVFVNVGIIHIQGKKKDNSMKDKSYTSVMIEEQYWLKSIKNPILQVNPTKYLSVSSTITIYAPIIANFRDEMTSVDVWAKITK